MATSKTEESIYDSRTIIFRTFLVVSYVCFGSGIFYLLERDEASREAAEFEEYYNKTMKSILGRSLSNDTEMQIIIEEIRRTFLQDSFPIEWDFIGGLNISVQAVTTIGYGNTVPKTVAGRMFLIVYATVGIPLMAMMLTTFGERLKLTTRKIIISFERKVRKKSQPQNIQRKSLIAVSFLTVVFLCLTSAISSLIEDWDFSLALYVWFVSFTTIGFGDFVPQGSGETSALYALEVMYALAAFFLGLTLIATILHALSDWVNSKKPPTKEGIKKSLGRMTSSLSAHKEELSMHVSDPVSDPFSDPDSNP